VPSSAARDAFRAGDRNKLERVPQPAWQSRTAPYVENYQLRLNMDQGDSRLHCAISFERYDKSYVAEKLRADWIRWLGKRGMWSRDRSPNFPADCPRAGCHLLHQQARLARDDRRCSMTLKSSG
jgi:soluble lytic murein transglycosylase